MKDMIINRSPKKYQLIRILLRIFLVVVALLLALVVAINIPAFQTFVAQRFINSIHAKTGTQLSIGSVKIAFPKTVVITDVYIQDQQADTLLYMHSLKLDLDLLALFKNKGYANKVDLENVVAHIKTTSENQFNFQFILDALSSSTPDTTTKSSPWSIRGKDVSLKNIQFSFTDEHANTDFRIALNNFEGSIKDLDFDKKHIDLDKFILKNTSVQIILSKAGNGEKSAKADNIASDENEKAKIPILFPGWDISINHFALKNTNFRYDDMTYLKLPKGFDSRHILANNINTEIHKAKISDDILKAEINSLSFKEACGFDLEKFTVNAHLTEQIAELKNLECETSRSKISGDVSLSFSSFNDLLVNTGNSESAIDLKYAVVSTGDLFLLEHTLATDSFFGKFGKSNVSISARANGKINDLNVEHLEISALQKTTVKLHGRIAGLPEVKKLRFNTKIDRLSTILPDVYRFVDAKSFAGLNLPPSIEIKGSATGKLDSLLADIQLTTGYGAIAAKTFYQNRRDGSDTIHLDFNLHDLHAGLILRDSLLGNATVSGSATASKKGDGPLNGSAIVTIENAQYNSYTYKNIQIKGQKERDFYSSTVSSSDTNITFDLTADADLHDVKKKYTAILNLSRVNFLALNFTKKDLSLSTNLKAELNYAGLNNSDGNLNLVNTNLISDEKVIPVKVLDLKASSSSEGIDLKLNSDLADGTINGNITSDSLIKTLQIAFQKYFNQPTTNDLHAGRHLSFRMNVHLPKEIITLINPKIEALEINKFEGDYSSDNNALSLELQMPRINYSGVLLDTVDMVLDGKNDVMSANLFLKKVSYNNFRIEKFRIKENTDHGKIVSEISIRDSSESLKYLFTNELEVREDFTKIRFLPEGLILDSKAWSVDLDNKFVKQKSHTDSVETFSIRQFVFTNDSQSFGIISESRNQKIEFKNFNLGNLLNIAEFQEKDSTSTQRAKLISGDLNGEIVFPSFRNLNGVNANLAINNLYVLDSLVGNLAFKIKAGNNKMDVDVRIESQENKILVSGSVDHLTETPALNLNVLLDITNLHSLERFSFGTLSKMSGKIDGKVAVKGTMQKLEINGYIGFDRTAFKVNSLNFYANIKQEKITLTNKTIHFNNFEIEDTSAKKLTVNGDILMNNLTMKGFDLSIVTKKFQPINSTVADNKVLYGKLSLGIDINLKGDFKNPKIVADIKIDSVTNLTYALPGSELKLVTSEGIVQFLDSVQAFDTCATAQHGDYMTDSIMSRIKGINVKAHVDIDRGAKFTIDIDPKSGDYLTLSGKASLDILSDETGKQSINGIYEVSSGFYELSFYDLVKKKFTIKEGSTIAWSGRPMDAEMNITAEYVVRASSVGLVANETSSMSEEEKKTFNRRLPYEIHLNIKGLISKPEISFNIFLPNQYMSDNPMVAAKLTQLNTEEMTPQLNKQVFALLVTGGFMPESPMANTGSSNIASTAARNSVNGILSNQLNNVSGKYISGVDVNFGLTSYEDYASSSGDLRTEMDIQVSKKLFNDRLTVEAENSFGMKKYESTSTTQQGYGQFAVIYSLTESGEYRLRAYYQNAYDPFDGDFSYSGVALIFEKEFDSLKRNRKPVAVQPPENNK